MHIALPIFLLTASVVVLATIARWIRLSAPLLLVAVGAVVSFLPFMPYPFEVDPEIVLLGFLPPLLFAAASNTSLIDLSRERRQILQMSVLLVLFTAFGVALVAWKLLDVPFAAAVALGAVVAPPDAVAATAVARRIGLPRRVVSVLEGESLFNDATALVTVNTAKGLIAGGAGATTVFTAGRDFLWASVGGAAIGFVAYLLVSWVWRHVTDTVTVVALSFLSPWIAYLPAEEVHASGVIAAVVCGVATSHAAPKIQTAQSRVSERLNWASITFLLENMVFLLIGLQTRTIVEGVRHSGSGLGRTFAIAVLVLLTVMALRPIWLLGSEIVSRRMGWSSTAMSGRETAIASWAGMRGVVTLAAAFLLPRETPERQAMVFIALFVTVGTLVLQGFSLGFLSRRLDLHGPDPREDALQTAQLTQAAVNAGNRRLDEELDDSEFEVPEQVLISLRHQGTRRANLAWERLGHSDDTSETPSDAYRRLRSAMLEAERAKVLKLRDKGIMDHDVLQQVMQLLDVEESMIARVRDHDEALNERVLLTPEERQFGCEHLADAPFAVDPNTPEGCEECLRDGTVWVHLRLCLACGHVGCCDSSVGKHASKHYAETDHPVMRSFEPGEGWRWCFADSVLG
ncbi:Na+/H+ antiporter [Flexivirga endophytica]|uniref:Na+/H+ antiporter n=1 Tax=Flexivirga endophytica TaxID=1849103 RepID=A0A916WY24_9MICO|nr:Na+/H+ antiporter [Flexivirga endophytica]GGB38614.1 Na+/H+ antiporter [Flexivirga endophytica]GHB46612.1 Na+/H+ antiporter [Flexivirga endophytica]